jgi:hypothetical protein
MDRDGLLCRGCVHARGGPVARAAVISMRPGGRRSQIVGAKPSEFMILLCTGGPAVRIRGELDRYSEPEKPRIEYQDWFTPWQTLPDVGSVLI